MIDLILPLIKQFLPFAQEKMGFKNPPRMFLRKDEKNAADPLGKTAFYNPQSSSVTIYTTNRHIKDVMRSLSHELVHHAQHERGDFKNCGEMGEGYAQKDEHLREMEREAYELGNMCFRDWEDGIKNTIYFEHLNMKKGDQKKMSTTKQWKNKEIKSLLTESWGFKMDLDKLTEDIGGAGGEETEKESEEEDYVSKREKDGNLEEDSGAKKGDQSATRVDYPDAKDGDEETGHGESAGDQSKTKDDYIKEDSGEEEGHHYRDNEMNDDDHIKAIEHHLAALKKDHSYDEEKVDEKKARGRKGPHTRGAPDNRARQENKVRRLIRKALSEVVKAQKTKKG